MNLGAFVVVSITKYPWKTQGYFYSISSCEDIAVELYQRNTDGMSIHFFLQITIVSFDMVFIFTRQKQFSYRSFPTTGAPSMSINEIQKARY